MTAKASREKLVKLMDKYNLTSPIVARLIGVKAQTVRAWRCGHRPTPQHAITLIDLTYGR